MPLAFGTAKLWNANSSRLGGVLPNYSVAAECRAEHGHRYQVLTPLSSAGSAELETAVCPEERWRGRGSNSFLKRATIGRRPVVMNYSPRTSQMAHRIVRRPSLVIIDLLPVQCLSNILRQRGWWLLPCPRFGFQQFLRKLRFFPPLKEYRQHHA